MYLCKSVSRGFTHISSDYGQQIARSSLNTDERSLKQIDSKKSIHIIKSFEFIHYVSC